MQSRPKFSIFSLANFFIRSMRYHERMTLLALILFIPLFTFSYLFISEKSQGIHNIDAKIVGSKLNSKLLTFVKSLQYYRGISYSFDIDSLSNKSNNAFKALKLSALPISKQYKELNMPILAKEWEKIQNSLSYLFKTKKKKNSLHYFLEVTKLIQKVYRLIERNGSELETILHQSIQMYTLEKILYEKMPLLLENIAITRGIMTNTLHKKSLQQTELDITLKNHYTMQQAAIEIRSMIDYYKIKDIHLDVTQDAYDLFDRTLDDIRQNNFSTDAKTFFKEATKVINTLHSFTDRSQKVYEKALHELFMNENETYINLLFLLITALLVALYIYAAIYVLAKRHLKKLQIGASRLSKLNYNHKISINGHDEFSEIANSINELAYTLKFDLELIDKYIPVSKTDTKGIITEVNNAFCQLTGFTKKELIGKTHNLMRHPNNKDAYFKQLWKTILKGDVWDAELINKNKEGDDIWVNLHISPITNNNGEIIGFTGLHSNITEKKKAIELAITDNLTQIYNRQYFNQILDRDIKKAQRYEYHFSLIMLDLDNFKQLNDTYGHLQGDEMLKRFTTLVASLLRNTDTFARWGGEEFMILLPYTTLEQATTLAESLRTTIENYCKNAHKSTTVSLGVTAFELDDDRDQLISRCDKNLYKAKELGRNRVISQ